MKSDYSGRRKFLSTLSATTAGGLLVNPGSFFSPSEVSENSIQTGEYLFAPGTTYLNTGTLGPCRRETIEESKRAWEELESLPVKFYGKWGAEEMAEKTRIVAARFLGCDISEMAITASTTNGMNAIAQGLQLKNGDRILTTDQEHGGGALCWSYFEKHYGVVVDKVSLAKGDVTEDEILNKIANGIQRNTRLISISHIFSSTGLRLPIAKISAIARSRNILCVVDGAQAVGAIRVNMKELGCHAYATSGHKWLMGPKGTGLLYLSKEAQETIKPMQFESSFNTYHDSSGVVNLPCILGLAKAIGYIESIGIDKVEQHNIALRNKLYEKLKNVSRLTMASPLSAPLASPLLAYRIPDGLDRTAFVRMLYEKHKLSIRPTHPQWFNGIRFSLHIFNTESEIEFASEVIRKEIG